jgi:hypothetical protein
MLKIAIKCEHVIPRETGGNLCAKGASAFLLRRTGWRKVNPSEY